MVCQRTYPKLILNINKDNKAICLIKDKSAEEMVEWIDIAGLEETSLNEYEESSEFSNSLART